VLAAGGLAAGLAILQRREAWAFVTAVMVNAAVSLVLVYQHQSTALQDWWVWLVQANVIASAAAAFVWLTAARLIYGVDRPILGQAPLLTLQLALGVLGNVVVLARSAALLVVEPGSLAVEVAQAGSLGGWLAMAAAMVPVVWYLRRLLLLGGVPLLVALGL